MIEYLNFIALVIATGLLTMIFLRLNEFIRLIMEINNIKQATHENKNHACFECNIIE
jgi:hypothetical protein